MSHLASLILRCVLGGAALGLIAATLLAAPGRPAFPITAAHGGMIVTVKDAAWVKNPESYPGAQPKGLLIRFNVSSDKTAPFRISYANVRTITMHHDSVVFTTSLSDKGSFFSTWLSPGWPDVRVLFHAADLNETTEATDGDAIEALHWSDVPAPTAMDTPVIVNQTRTTSHGSQATLVKIEEVAANGGKTRLVFRLRPSPRIPGLKMSLSTQDFGLTDQGGAALVDRFAAYGVTNGDAIANGMQFYDNGYATLDVQKTPHVLGAKSLNIDMSVQESSETFRDPRCFRDVVVDIPLTGLPGAAGDRPETPLAVVRSGPLAATLEAITPDQNDLWHIRLWMKSAPGGPDYHIEHCTLNASGPSGVTRLSDMAGGLTPYAWKLNNEAPAPNEVLTDFSISAPRKIPRDATSLFLTVTAVQQKTINRLFHFPHISTVGPGVSMPVTITARQIADNGSAPLAAGGATLTITSIERVRSGARGKNGEDRLNLHYKMGNVATQSGWRSLFPMNATDDKGRSIDFGDVSTFSTGGGGDYLQVDPPAPDATFFSVDIRSTETVQTAPPVSFTLSGVPIPAAWMAAGQ